MKRFKVLLLTSLVVLFTTYANATTNMAPIIAYLLSDTEPQGEITINDPVLKKVLASTFDNTPYSPAIDIQGVIDAGGLSVTVPYTVDTAPVTLRAYSTSVILDAAVTQDDEAGIVATFAWAEQINLPVGSGFFTATITIDDSGASIPDNTYNAKQLDIEDDSAGLVAATFSYDTDNVGGTGTLTLEIMPGIPDRMFGQADNTGNVETHKFLYLPVTNTTTGKTWLNNNLGANYANVNDPAFDLSQQATASDDHNAYGSLFQWGRKADGHELINWISGSEGEGVHGITGTNSDDPTDALFILAYDWRVTQDDTLWASESSVNNVCPVGYRVPTGGELDEERGSWGSNDAAGALASTLILPMGGYRNIFEDGLVDAEGELGTYWGSTVSGTSVQFLHFTENDVTFYESDRGMGMTVRCIKVSTEEVASNAVLEQIGAEGDSGDTVNSVVTVVQLAEILPPLTGIVAANEAAYQDYIDANPDLFSEPATQEEVQAMIDAVNAVQEVIVASNVVLIQIGLEADNPDTIDSIVTVAQLNVILPSLIDVDAANETPYQDYIDANPDLFSSPATQAEVQEMVDAVNVAEYPFPSDITIDNAALQKVIISIYDDTPYAPAIDIQGVIDAGGLNISVPYTVTNTPVTLPAYNTSVILDASVSQDDEAGIVATFAWTEQTNLPVGSGTFTATITIDDSAASVPDNIWNAKQLDIEDYSEGLVAATFSYATDDAGGTGTFTLRLSPVIYDRMYGKADNTGNVETHKFLYLPITNTSTGKTWLNNNLGANYANVNSPVFDPAQQATASDDSNAYGSHFQWGRRADGHELITWIDGGIGIGVNGTTSTNSDDPTDALFITEGSDPWDWRVTQDDTLWTSEYSVNNVCPVGYRVPTGEDMDEERLSWGSNNAVGALASTLALSLTGFRSYFGGGVNGGTYGYYWTSSTLVGWSWAVNLFFNETYAYTTSNYRAEGRSVRCIKMSTEDVVSNAVLDQIGAEGDSGDTVNSVVTVAQLAEIIPVVTNIIAIYEAAYQDYIDANPDLFSEPATQVEVQAMIHAVNSNPTASD